MGNSNKPLYAYKLGACWCAVSSDNLTMHLHATMAASGPNFGIQMTDILVHSLHSSGAMALLCANLDHDKIRLLAQWRSDKMLCYLHIQAYLIISPLAAAMLQYGNFNFIPYQTGSLLMGSSWGFTTQHSEACKPRMWGCRWGEGTYDITCH